MKNKAYFTAFLAIFALEGCSPVASNISKNALRSRNSQRGRSDESNAGRVRTPDVRDLFSVPFNVRVISLRNLSTSVQNWSSQEKSQIVLSQSETERLANGEQVTIDLDTTLADTEQKPLRRFTVKLGFGLERAVLDQRLSALELSTRNNSLERSLDLRLEPQQKVLLQFKNISQSPELAEFVKDHLLAVAVVAHHATADSATTEGAATHSGQNSQDPDSQ